MKILGALVPLVAADHETSASNHYTEKSLKTAAAGTGLYMGTVMRFPNDPEYWNADYLAMGPE